MKLRPVKELAEKVGIKNASHLRAKTGLGVGTCYQLWDGTATRFDLSTLNTLCNVLQIGPAFLFDYTPDVEPQTGGPGAAEAETKAKTLRRSSPAKKRESKARQAIAGAI